MSVEITFSDVLIEPQYSEIRSRRDVDLSCDLGLTQLTVPLISSNMRDITGVKMAIEMMNNGCLGILHRFMPIEENVNCFKEVLVEIRKKGFSEKLAPYQVGVSVGVKEEEKERFIQLVNNGARVFCIDIAHGHSIAMKEMIEFMRRQSKKVKVDIYIIAGNIATSKAAIDLVEWGADCLKVGIGPGAVCSTRTSTGVGVPQLHALQQIAKKNLKVPIISDGGIKIPGDVAKALKYADAVMIGSLFSGTTETPGNVYKNLEGQYYKTYGGSASGENKVKSGNSNTFVEGVVKMVPFKGHVKYVVREIIDGLQSSFSLSGSRNLKEFQKKAILREISSGSKIESKI